MTKKKSSPYPGEGTENAAKTAIPETDILQDQAPGQPAEEPEPQEDINAKLEELINEVAGLRSDNVRQREKIAEQAGIIEQQKAQLSELAGKTDVNTKTRLAGAHGRKMDPYEMEIPQGDIHVHDKFDPTLFVEIVCLPKEGVPFSILDFYPPGSDVLAQYAFTLDEKGAAHYKVPRNFAEGQLRNDGGMKFILSSPKELVIRKPAEKGVGTTNVLVRAHPEYPPIL